MEKNQAKQFLDALSGNAEIREYMKAHALPEGAAKEDALVDVAAHFGYAITKEDLAKEVARRSEAADAARKTAEKEIKALSDNELDSVAGGKDHSNCHDTFKNFENCWWEDGCDVAYNQYPTYICHITTNIF